MTATRWLRPQIAALTIGALGLFASATVLAPHATTTPLTPVAQSPAADTVGGGTTTRGDASHSQMSSGETSTSGSATTTGDRKSVV